MERIFGSFVALMTFAASAAVASTTSYTGTLSSPEDGFYQVIDLPFSGEVTLQTYGFGGGTNSAGTVVSAGGFDPLVAVFSGAGPSATIVDGTSDILGNYGPGVEGCPPVGTLTIGA